MEILEPIKQDLTKANNISFGGLSAKEIEINNKKNNNYGNLCEVTLDELRFDLFFEVSIYSYIDTREKNIDGKWIHSDPKKCHYRIEDISHFRKQNEFDRHNFYFISDSTVMPTEWCIMEYYDSVDKKKKVVPVVGNPDELNKRCGELYMQYRKELNKLYNNEIKLNEYFKSL